MYTGILHQGVNVGSDHLGREGANFFFSRLGIRKGGRGGVTQHIILKKKKLSNYKVLLASLGRKFIIWSNFFLISPTVNVKILRGGEDDLGAFGKSKTIDFLLKANSSIENGFSLGGKRFL